MTRRLLLALLCALPAAALGQTINYPPGPTTTWTTTTLGSRLEDFAQAGDADSGAAIARACAADSPIWLGPQTYAVSNFAGCNGARFIMRGTPGKSIIQRTAAGGGSNFFTVGAATVIIDGVTFDSNKAVVTANQWGALFNAGGQNVQVRHSVFENNSGTLGACFALVSTGPAAAGTFDFTDNEVTGCALNAATFGSVSNGRVSGNNIHDNSAIGAFIGSFGAVSGSNYARDIQVLGNRFVRNGSTGLQVGGFAAPYLFGTPQAVNTLVSGNQFLDNTSSDLTVQADYTTVTGNKMWQLNVTPTFGILCNSRWSRIEANEINLAGASYGIDCGGAVEPSIHDNTIVMTSGAAIDPGGTTNGSVRRNRLILSGTATGVSIFDVETDASVVPFPSHTSALDISDNTVEMSGASTKGVALFDDAGGFTGMLPVSIKVNRFIRTNSAASANDISYLAGGAAVQISGNTDGGATQQFINPNGNNDLVPDPVFDWITTTAGASATIRSVTPALQNLYNGGGSIVYVLPTAGGASYTAATTLAATCSGTSPTGVAMTPLISQGAIVGVRVTANGTGCTGTPSVTATDSGGGSGATFAATNIPTPLGRQLQLTTNNVTSVMQTSGGAMSLLPSIPVVITSGKGEAVTITVQGTSFNWNVAQSTLPTFTITTLPPNSNTTCSATYNGAEARVSNSAVGKWPVRCNGTNWLFPDGTVVN